MKAAATSFLLFVCPPLPADVPAGYYASAEGKTGAALRLALHQIIDNHNSRPYGGGMTETRGAVETLDQTPGNASSVRLVYSGLDVLKSTFGSGNGFWDQEHLWPRSYGTETGTPLSDLHHLRACDSTVNSARGQKHFDESLASDGNFFEPAHPEAPGTSRDTNSWEPRETEKGDIARAMFYIDIRYEGDAGEPDLRLTDDLAIVVTGNTNMGRLTTLIEWHLLDPPDAAERARNDGVCVYQENRNPFVDRPEWVLEVFGNPLRLTMTLKGSTLQLRWPAGLRRSQVEHSTNLNAWTVFPWSAQIIGDENISTLQWYQTRTFFRLVVR